MSVSWLASVLPYWATFDKFWQENLYAKVAQIFRSFLDYFENVSFWVKTAKTTFWASVENF